VRKGRLKKIFFWIRKVGQKRTEDVGWARGGGENVGLNLFPMDKNSAVSIGVQARMKLTEGASEGFF